MGKYKIKEQKNTESIESVVSDIFDDYNKTNGFYIVNDIDIELIEQIKIKKKEENILELKISHKSLSQARSKNIVDDVPESVKLKNNILERLTGTTVESRKKEMKKSVLPTGSSLISNNM